MISMGDADRLLEEDLRYFEVAVSSAVTVRISQNQFDALVSFTFNVGIGAFGGSTLLSLLNRKHYISAAEQFLRWTIVSTISQQQNSFYAGLEEAVEYSLAWLSVAEKSMSCFYHES